MITLTKNGNAIVFTFSDNAHYLFDGTIEVPVNSLTLVTDNSQMATFRKSASNDIFISATYAELGMSKSELESWFKENACGSTGGGGVTSGEVETMIETSLEDYYDIDEVDAALSGKADSSAVTESINAAVSGKADSSAVTESINAAVSGKADTSAVTQEISAAISGKADSSSVYTKSEVDAAVSGKQDTLIAGDNITISGNVISAEGGGGGKAVNAGTNISITTGETADTINCTLNLENGTNSQSGGIKLKSNGADNSVSGRDACAFGGGNKAGGINSFVTGYYNTGNTNSAFISGYKNITTNNQEVLFGLFALSNGSQKTFNGNSGCTFFAVGNGESANEIRHNAFEIRQNGDIYIADTNDTSTTNYYEKPMIKLQDALGGGGSSYTAGDGIDITNDVISVTGKVDTTAFTSYSAATDARLSEDEEVTAAALNALNDGKQDTLIAGSGITISGNVISAEGGNLVIELTQAEYDALVDKDPDTFYVITDAEAIDISNYYTKTEVNTALASKADTSAVTESINSAVSGKVNTSAYNAYTAATDARISEDEEVTAAALNALNDRVDAIDITVDSALDATSENPVQNKVIYAVIGDIESLLSNI